MAFPETGVRLVVQGEKAFFGTLGKAGKSIAGFGKAAAKTAIAGTAAVAAFGAAVGVASIKAAVDFESAFAGVIKTTTGLTDKFGNINEAGLEMQQGFRNLAKEIPTSVEELLAIGEVGGQLGIANDQLIDFTRTIADMGEASNLSTEDAAIGFARIAAVMGTSQDEISNMASAVVELGNSFETSESEILTFAQRIAGAGQVAGLTESDIFAIGAAMSSVGVQAEAGGTAVQKALLSMNEAAINGGDQMEIFAATAGIEADEFGAAWEEDAGGVFNEFVKGLGLAGDDAISILDELGLKDQRLTRAFLSLAGAGDKLTDTLDASSEAYELNTALTAEAEARYRTTESQFKIFKNTIKDLGITIGQALLPFVNDLLDLAKPLIAQLGQKLPGAMKKVSRFIKQAGETVSAFFGILKGSFSTRELVSLSEKFSTPFVVSALKISNFLKFKLVPAIQLVIGWIRDNLPRAISALSSFVTGTLIPVLSQVFNWLSVNIPIAIQILSDFWANTLQPALSNFAAFVTGTLIPAIIQVASWLMDNLPPAIETVAGWLTDVLIPAVSDIAAWLADVLPPVIQALADFFVNVLIPALVQVVSWVSANWPAFRDTVINTIQAVTDWVNANWPPFRDAVIGVIESIRSFIEQNFPPIWNAIIPIAQSIIRWIEDNWPIIRETVETVLNAVKDIAETIWNAVAPFIIEKVNDIVDWVRDNWPLIRETINDVLNTAKTIIETILNAIQTFWNQHGEQIMTIVQNTWDSIKVTISTIIDVIQGIIQTVLNIISGNWSDAWESIKSVVSDIWEGIKALVANGIDNIKQLVQIGMAELPGIVSGIGDALFRAGQAIVERLRAGLEQKLNEIRGWFSNKLKEITDLLPFSEPKDPSSPLHGLSNAGKAIVDNIVAGMNEATMQLQNAQMGMASTLGQTATVQAASGASSSMMTTNNVNFNTTVNNGMQAAQFEQRVLRTVKRGLQ